MAHPSWLWKEREFCAQQVCCLDSLLCPTLHPGKVARQKATPKLERLSQEANTWGPVLQSTGVLRTDCNRRWGGSSVSPLPHQHFFVFYINFKEDVYSPAVMFPQRKEPCSPSHQDCGVWSELLASFPAPQRRSGGQGDVPVLQVTVRA